MESNPLINQFQHLNRSRIERLSQLVSPKQHAFFSLLPFLIHHNFPELPAYSGTDCPIGIIDYQADDDTIRIVQKRHAHFKYKRHGIRHYGFSALYLINRYGLLNLPEQLHFDLVLVHFPLSSEQQRALDHKLQLLTEWAEQQHIHIQFTLLEHNSLANSPPDPSLVNDIYLHGLVLAGAIPIWWLVPPGESYPKTVDNLSQQSHYYSLLDLGNHAPMTAVDCANATQQRLQQALEHGLHYCLDLVYLEQLLTHYPKVYPLCLRLKYLLHKGETEAVRLDQHVLKLQIIQNNKATSDTIKKLAQQSLYLAFKDPLSKPIKHPTHPWRRQALTQLSQYWDWANHDFLILDRRKQAHYTQCLEEHEQTAAYFSHVFDTLKHFCHQHQIHDLSLQDIEHKIYQLKSDKPHVLSQLPIGIKTKSPEEQLYCYRFSLEGEWKLSVIPLDTDTQTATYQAKTHLELMAWAVLNGLLNDSTRIVVIDKTQQITLKEIIALTEQLLRTELVDTTIEQILAGPQQIASLHLFANLDPEHQHVFAQQHDIQLTSLHNDPFNYANRGANLLYQIDALILTKQGEWQLAHFKGEQAPLHLLQYLIAWWSDNEDTHPISSWSPPQHHSQLINHHLQQMVNDVSTYFHQEKTGQFLTQLGYDLYLFRWQAEGADIKALPSSHVNEQLAAINGQFIPTYIDRRLDPDRKRFTLLSVQQANTINIIVEAKTNYTLIHIVDEYANLHQTQLTLQFETALSHYQYFINAIHQQHPTLSIRFYQLKPFGINQWQLTPLTVSPPSQKKGYLPVMIEMEAAKDNANCTITCGPKQFSGLANDSQLLQQLAHFILGLRASKIAYPLYINGIIFTDPSTATTADYLTQKHRFEQQLNQ